MQRNISIDLLKLLLAVSVVFLHTHIFYDFSALLGHSLVQGVFRLAVPVFLVITGYYFFYIDTLEKFKRWLQRIFILYAVWMVFYLPVWWAADASYKLSVIYNGYFVLWYIIGVLLGGSLLYLLRNIGEKNLFATAAVLFALGTLIQQIGNLHLLDGYLDWKFNRYTTHRNFLLVSFPFLALGFLLNKLDGAVFRNMEIKPRHICLLTGLVLAESLLNYFFVSKTESLDQMFSLFFAAPVIFWYALNRKIIGESKNLASLSTAIFLIHPVFIHHLKNYFPGQQTLFSIAVLLCSILAGLFLVQLNKKVKYLL
jgi:hypothetical protein